MNRSNKPLPVKNVWCWRRWIGADQAEDWCSKLKAIDGLFWAFTERPGRSRLLLAAYPETRTKAKALAKHWGGQVRAIRADAWLQASYTPPLRIGRKFQIVDENSAAMAKADLPRLHIPHGIAFGSGEHATTFMLLRALAAHDVAGRKVLDLGTGSGILALAARWLGAGKITATDFDPDAVRTARENEALNFSTPLIRWKRADVKQLRPATHYDLVLANLFSGILSEAAPQISACVATGGQLWLSGILRSQDDEVRAAYLGQGLARVRAVTRGKWVMQQWRKVDQAGVGGARKTTQAK